MKNLFPVSFDDEAALRAIIPRKPIDRRARMTAALASILGRYNEYRANCAELSAINTSALDESLASDCKSLYSSESEELNTLKKAILDGQSPISRSMCQYCTIGEPKTFDHYASKGRFPEFSMFSLNLIPCCGACNQTKGEAWTAKGHRHFINYYYDSFIQHTLLNAELRFQRSGDVAIVFSLAQHPNVTALQFAIMSSHLTDLGLFERFSERAAGVISEVRNVLPRLEMRIGQIIEWFQAEADAKANVYGPNYWQAAIFRQFATSHRFIEECLRTAWLPRACAEVAFLLSQPMSAAIDKQLRMLIETRAWRLYASRGFHDGQDYRDWFDARAELGMPEGRWV